MSHKTAAELGIHLPSPTAWPAMVTLGFAAIPTSILLGEHFNPEISGIVFWLGLLFFGFSLMGWAHEVIKDKNDAHTEAEIEQQQSDLSMVTKLILISEGAVFGGLFVHYFYHKDWFENVLHLGNLRPEGLLETSLPAIGTLILMFSSYTCHIAHHAMMHAEKGKAKTYLIVTVVLGLIFLGMQGHEWGYLHGMPEAFTSGSSLFGTLFYLMTGFHGAHVAIGIVLLALVYFRLEMDHMDEKRHFSFIAASWYWHFVDVIWIVLFFTVYLI